MAASRAHERAGISAGVSSAGVTSLPLATVHGALAPGDGMITCPIPQARLHDWLLVRWELDAAGLSAATMPAAEICAPGLVVGGGAGVPCRSAAGRPVVRYECQLPAALTTLRHLERVSLRLWSGTTAFAAPATMPVTVTWHRLVRT